MEIVRPTPDMLDEMARICFEAFDEVATRRGFSTDFTSMAVARHVLESQMSRSDFHSVAAVEAGRVLGSNFVQMSDEVAGIGPITVDRDQQGRGIGRVLMEAVTSAARERGFERIRLMQDLYNVASLSLYASMGFAVREPVALMQAPSIAGNDDTVREMTDGDVEACDALCRRILGRSRRNETARLMGGDLNPLVREVDGRIVGYLAGGLPGHGVADTSEDALALAGQLGLRRPEPFRLFFVPMTNTNLFRGALDAGARTVKAMSHMTVGPYEAPAGTWMPSISM